jgi:hypothetical protein
MRAMEAADHLALLERDTRSRALDDLATDRDEQGFDRRPSDVGRCGVYENRSQRLSVRVIHASEI